MPKTRHREISGILVVPMRAKQNAKSAHSALRATTANFALSRSVWIDLETPNFAADIENPNFPRTESNLRLGHTG